MAKKKLIKVGDRTLTTSTYGEVGEIRNRILNEEASFAMDMIQRWGLAMTHGKDGTIMQPGAVVERAFAISELAFKHIKENRMSAPFPFNKVYLDVDK